MSQSTINPYSALGTYFTNGLVTFIGAYSSGTVTLTELISEINTIIEGDFYTSASAQQQIEINANTTNAINSYVNSLLWGNKTILNAKQMKFARMLSREALRKIEVIALNNYLLDVEDNITKSDLTVPEQIPLLIATMLGETAFTYWNTDVNASGASQKWTGYYQSNQAYNYANIPSWVAAAIEGALVGYGSSPDANLEPTTAMVSSKMIAALQGALAVNIALVALQMIPRIQPGETHFRHKPKYSIGKSDISGNWVVNCLNPDSNGFYQGATFPPNQHQNAIDFGNSCPGGAFSINSGNQLIVQNE